MTIPDDDILKGGRHPVTYLRYSAAREELQTYALRVASDVGYDETRALRLSELATLVRATDTSDLSEEDVRRFLQMDLALEVIGEDGYIRYIAVEIAFYAEQSGVDRAVANARLLERFTGRPTCACIAVGRDFRDLPEAALTYDYPVLLNTISGEPVYLHQLNERNIERAMTERRHQRKRYGH